MIFNNLRIKLQYASISESFQLFYPTGNSNGGGGREGEIQPTAVLTRVTPPYANTLVCINFH